MNAPFSMGPHLLLTSLLLAALPGTVQANGRMNAKAASRANTAFAVDVYRALAKTEGSLFFSPYSVSTALTMTSGGARANTLKEMRETLHLTAPPHAGFGLLQSKLEAASAKGVKLEIANRLWVAGDLALAAPFQSLVAKHYRAGAGKVSFTDPEKARATINGWVSEKTKERIEELLPSGSIDTNTRLVLTNAVYFKGQWLAKFDEAATRARPFWTEEEKSVETSFMHQKGRFAYGRTKTGLEVLELPYRGGRLVMNIVLPERGALTALEEQLTPEALGAWLAVPGKQNVQVALPRFETDFDIELSAILQGLGMKAAFTPSANFGGIAREKPLFIALVQHKAFVEVSEEGTEATAATAVVMTKGFGGPRIASFVADRPFLFLIRDKQTGAILFLGRYTGPQSPKEK